MKTLANAADAHEIDQRLLALTPNDQRRFGRMSAGEAVCHLREAYRIALGELPVQPMPWPIPGPVLRFLALRVPLQWRPGVPTLPEIDMSRRTVSPATFEADRAELLAAHRRFVALRDNHQRHPIFGVMRPSDWMRWGYLHTDHHLRQFGR